MKKKLTAVFLWLLVSQFILYANPVSPKYFSEIQFRESGWIIELFAYDLYPQLDSVYLTSKSDTAYLKSGCLTPAENYYFLITNDSLTSRLEIDQTNDTISIYLNIYDYDFPDDQMIIGKLPLESSQSLCRKAGDSYTPDIWYIDSTPTLGSENDTENAMGQIDYLIFDEMGNPIDSVGIFLGVRFDFSTWGDSLFIYTDSLGYCTYHYYATRTYFKFLKDGFIEQDTSILIYPDSTIDLTITLEPVEYGIDNPESQIASQYYLSPAYPNPFNNITHFSYQLPVEGFINISAYSINGQLIAELFKGYHYAGNYSISWNAEYVPSGVYIIIMKTSQGILRQKCMLLK